MPRAPNRSKNAACGLTTATSGASASTAPRVNLSSPATSSPSPVPSGPPAAGGGGTAGLQDTVLFEVGGAAMLIGLGGIAYRRRITRKR